MIPSLEEMRAKLPQPGAVHHEPTPPQLQPQKPVVVIKEEDIMPKESRVESDKCYQDIVNSIADIEKNYQEAIKKMSNVQSNSESSSQETGNKLKMLGSRFDQLESKLSDLDLKDSIGDGTELVKKELTLMENQLIDDIHKTTDSNIERFEIELHNLKMQMLSILDVLEKGDSKTFSNCKNLFLDIVRKEAEKSARKVEAAQQKAIENQKKMCIDNVNAIKKLKDSLKAEKNRNDALERRLVKLEKAPSTSRESLASQTSSSSHRDKTKTPSTKSIETKSAKKQKQKQKIQQELKNVITINDAYFDREMPVSKVKETSEVRDEKSPIKPANSSTSSTKNTPRDSKPPPPSKHDPPKQQQQTPKAGKENTPKSQSKISSATKGSSNKQQQQQENLSYFEKAHMYLYQLTDNQSSQNAGDRLEQPKFVNKDDLITVPVLSQAPINWAIRRHTKMETATEPVQHGSVFYTKTPGYRVQFRARIDRLHGDVYFSIRIMKGVFDDQMSWPFTQKFKICISDRKKKEPAKDWIIPGDESNWGKIVLRKAVGKRDRVNSDWIGPFDVSHYISKELFHFEVSLFP